MPSMSPLARVLPSGLAEGKSPKEALRCRKRPLARQLYRLLERTATKGLRP